MTLMYIPQPAIPTWNANDTVHSFHYGVSAYLDLPYPGRSCTNQRDKALLPTLP